MTFKKLVDSQDQWLVNNNISVERRKEMDKQPVLPKIVKKEEKKKVKTNDSLKYEKFVKKHY